MTTLACNKDGKDCTEFLNAYPDCEVPEPELVGNGHCDGHPYSSPQCKNDGGDCDKECDVENPDWIGDGYCGKCDLYPS